MNVDRTSKSMQSPSDMLSRCSPTAWLRTWTAKLFHLCEKSGIQRPEVETRQQSAAASDSPIEAHLDATVRRLLLQIARQTIWDAVVAERKSNTDFEVSHPALFEPKGCFVSLTNAGEWRGCVGQLAPQQPLWETVRENARNAALNDPRFDPV